MDSSQEDCNVFLCWGGSLRWQELDEGSRARRTLMSQADSVVGGSLCILAGIVRGFGRTCRTLVSQMVCYACEI